MIRNVMVVGKRGRLIYSHAFAPNTSLTQSLQGIGALVSIVHQTSPMITGSSIKKIKLSEEYLLIHANGSLLFAISVDDGNSKENQRKLQMFVDTFMSKYEEIIPFLDENTDLEVFNDMTKIIQESNFFS